jgi:putative transposase
MSGDRYHIVNQHAVHFLTLTVVDWIDLFTRKEFSLIVVESLNYCAANKNLIIYGWVIMSSHIHLLCKVNEPDGLSSVLRDLKKFISKQIIKQVDDVGESRKEWLLNRFSYEAKRIHRAKNYKVWKDDNHAIEIDAYIDIEQKLNYIHDNPVKALIVSQAEHYYFSSAIDYAEGKGIVTISRI